MGRVYEYFLGQFASAEGKGVGEFYTRTSVVKTLVEILEEERKIERFNVDKLQIINEIKGKSIITKSNIPNKKDISDHLPIKFQLEVEEY